MYFLLSEVKDFKITALLIKRIDQDRGSEGVASGETPGNSGDLNVRIKRVLVSLDKGSNGTRLKPGKEFMLVNGVVEMDDDDVEEEGVSADLRIVHFDSFDDLEFLELFLEDLSISEAIKTVFILSLTALYTILSFVCLYRGVKDVMKVFMKAFDEEKGRKQRRKEKWRKGGNRIEKTPKTRKTRLTPKLFDLPQ
jgi:hypothetical protein